MTGTHRRPRAYFTKKLHQLLEVLDTNPERSFEYQHKYAPAGACTARVSQVWVCGSYARGALDCNDLDLVVQFEFALAVRAAGLPAAHHTRRAFWGSIRDVQVFEGEPKRNSSYVDMSDHAVLVWHTGMDWRSAVAAITVSPSVGRFAREIDSLPVDPPRVRMPVHEALELAHGHALGVVTWRWEPFDSSPPGLHPQTACEEAAVHWVAHSRGSDAQAVFMPLMVTLRRLKADGHVSRVPRTRGWDCDVPHLLWEGYEVHLGYSRTKVDRLAHQRALRGFIVVPYLRRAGPNGLWLIERGPRFNTAMKELRDRLWRARLA